MSMRQRISGRFFPRVPTAAQPAAPHRCQTAGYSAHEARIAIIWPEASPFSPAATTRLCRFYRRANPDRDAPPSSRRTNRTNGQTSRMSKMSRNGQTDGQDTISKRVSCLSGVRPAAHSVVRNQPDVIHAPDFACGDQAPVHRGLEARAKPLRLASAASRRSLRHG